MNAEALIGTVLGTCTLQKLLGRGNMGAVYFAQQARPRRPVAVKVLLPSTPSLTAFLETVDPAHHWHSLQRVVMENRTILWVCEHHKQIGIPL